MLSSWLSRTPRFQTAAAGWMILAPLVTVCSMLTSLFRRERLSNQARSVLFSLTLSRRDAHQLLMSVIQSRSRPRTSSTPSSGMLAYACLSSANRWWLMLWRPKTDATLSCMWWIPRVLDDCPVAHCSLHGEFLNFFHRRQTKTTNNKQNTQKIKKQKQYKYWFKKQKTAVHIKKKALQTNR